MPSLNLSGLSKKLLKDHINRWVFSNSKTDLYLVGGYLRDAILSRESMDIDYVIKNDPAEIARKLARRFNGTLVTFKGIVFRVVLKNERNIDFTPLKGRIEDNLMLRDFTINAMAWSPQKGLIDPHKGLEDLRKGVIRVLSERSIIDDPLRILRAYRHACELSFSIDSDTSRLLSLHAHELKNVPHERITAEFFKILNQKNSYIYIRKATIHNVLQEVFKVNKGILLKNLKLLRDYEAFIECNRKRINNLLKKRGFIDFLNEEFSEGLTRDGLIKLFLISKDRLWETLLKPGKKIRKAISYMTEGLGAYTNHELYDVFLLSGGYVYEMALIISVVMDRGFESLLKSADRFIECKKKPLLDGNDIQRLLGERKGRIVGRAIASLHKAQYTEEVRTKRQAIDFIISNFT